jgi:hypothetical protein
LNKTAIALAADSKVTLSIEGRQKTYDTVDKIFSLSKTEPVGAMIYGSAEFMGFPWETILKEYRRRDPTKSFDTVFHWANDLINFLKGFFPFTMQDNLDAAYRIGSSSVAQIYERYFEFLAEGLANQEIFEGLKEEIELNILAIEEGADFVSEDEWKALEANYNELLTHLSTTGPAEGYEELQPLVRKYVELAIRKQRPSPGHSGLVVAGFGEKEFLPSLVSFQVDGIVCGRMKHREHNKFDTTRRSQGAIIPFAQTDMVYRFMEGVDPEYILQLQASMRDLLVQNSKDTAAALGHTAEEIEALGIPLENAANAALKEFWAEDKKIRWERFASPIIDMTKSLPKDELAHLAEALVSLTSLQRRVSREIETVGGAIDVAVISKGDGFVWVKRKHYFSPDRNLRFVNGYFSEFGNQRKSQGEKNGNA